MTEPPQEWAAPGAPTTPSGEPSPGTGASAGPAAPPEWQTPPGWGGSAGSGTAAPGGALWGAPRPVDVKPGVVPLRPLGLGELLDGAVAIIRRYPRPTLGLSVGVALVVTLLNTILSLTALRGVLSLDASSFESTGGELGWAVNGSAISGAVAGVLATILIALLAGVMLSGFITAVVGRAVLGRPMTFADAWAQVWPLLFRLVGLALLTGLIVGGVAFGGLAVAGAVGFLVGGGGIALAVLLGIGALVLSVRLYIQLSLASSVLVLENATIGTSMRRSRVLVRGSWWRVFGILLLTWIIGAFAAQVLQVPFLLLGISDSGFGATGELSSVEIVMGSLGAGIASAVVAPFAAGVRALLYVDRRVRAEGLDIALTAAVREQPTTP
ncbi:MAG TPA: hypothetical protein VNA30_07855 [Mycobacteriales bacterium]|nr:hypothetical protein [Mycobacteriales bacterium]